MLSELISIDLMRIRSVNTTPRHCSRGFTLVEVVTAALLGSLLLAIFLTFAFRFTQVYNELQGAELKMSAEANSVLDKIEEDLGSVIFQKDDYEWLSYWDHPSDAQTLQPLMNTNVTVGNRVNDFEPDKSGTLLCITRSPQLEEEEKKIW